jgi:hypothetical protein
VAGDVEPGQAAGVEVAGVVDEHVDAAEALDRVGRDRGGGRGVGDVGAVGDRLAAGGHDLVGDALGEAHVAAAVAGEHVAEVVDDHLGATLGERQRVCAAEAAAGAGHDRHLSVEAQLLSHRPVLSGLDRP